MYAMTGFGASASASASLTAGGSASSSGSGRSHTSDGGSLPCVSAAELSRAIADCKRLGPFGPTGIAACLRAASPVCASAPLLDAPVVVTAEQAAYVNARPASTPGRQTAQVTVAQPGAYKLPVPAAVPASTTADAAPEAEGGVPTWLWIVGGVAVLGTAAVIYKRKKAA